METLNLRIEALVRRGFDFLTDEELVIAAAFVEKRNSPRFGDNLPSEEFDGWAETVCSGLAGWGGSLGKPGMMTEEVMFKDKGVWTNRDIPTSIKKSELHDKIKNKIGRFFDGTTVNFSKLSKASAMAAISNGWAQAVDLSDYPNGLNVGDYYHDLVLFLANQKENEYSPKSA